MAIQKTITPIDNSVYLERPLASENEINEILNNSKKVLSNGRIHLLMSEL